MSLKCTADYKNIIFLKLCLIKNKVDFLLYWQELGSPSKSNQEHCLCLLQSLSNHVESEEATSSVIPPARMNVGFCKAIEAKGLCACIMLEAIFMLI